ncbi:unnamed protein product [Bursaphelenchus xylophilus]|uniref:(pine wood nematode) hypothetical protein n=1 Tax=Bursaphelenchus xylophilus TaxID=6326 RepID=A0A1I7S8G9_BURXY|nr:unnamed protein product [Bursaphelenchus xylophilus]CAG9121077.1 unnamed protein product [Bursaphelenchus xylophilus]
MPVALPAFAHKTPDFRSDLTQISTQRDNAASATGSENDDDEWSQRNQVNRSDERPFLSRRRPFFDRDG